jgi:hypothetical protein
MMSYFFFAVCLIFIPVVGPIIIGYYLGIAWGIGALILQGVIHEGYAQKKNGYDDEEGDDDED